jgi:hypothetical protein
MTIVIDVQTGPVLARLNSMLDQINYVKRTGIGSELSKWQTEDMHRDRPFTMKSRAAGRATTIVRPHSLYEMTRSETASRQFLRASIRYQKFLASGKRVRKRKPKYVRIATSGYRKWSTRPILRQTLVAKLKDRLDALVSSKLRWELSRGKAVAAHAHDEAAHIAKVWAIRVYGAAGAAAVRAVEAVERLERRSGGGGEM